MPPSNPPERPALSYRLGTRADFLRQMLDRLPWQTIPDGPHAGARPLANLATHGERDPTAALLDAFAVVADVLTFYQERIANEGFLRTATEPRSVLELARTLGHELSPGLAASTWLAFTVEDTAGAPEQVLVEPGAVRVLSIPGQDERPQPFEIVERLVARPEWNQLQPVTSVPEELTLGADALWLRWPQANLAPGDALLIVGRARETDKNSAAWELRTVAAVAPEPAAGRARVALVPQAAPKNVPSSDVSGGGVFALRQRAAVFGHNAPDWRTMPATVQAQYGASQDNTWPGFAVGLINGRLYLDNLYPRLLPGTWVVLVAGDARVLYWVDSVQASGYTNFALTAHCSALDLRPTPAGTSSGTDISAFAAHRRTTLVLGQAEALPLGSRPLVDETWGTDLLAPLPDVRPAHGAAALDEPDKISLERVVHGLEPGRTLVVTGKRLRARVLAQALTLTADSGVSAPYAPGDLLFVIRRPSEPQAVPGEPARRTWRLADAAGFEGSADLPDGALRLEPALPKDPVISEAVTLKDVLQSPTRTALRFTAPLKSWYDRATVVLHGNVAAATHGETVSEVLGSGDGGQPNQRFTLKRGPVTWIPGPAGGRRSTLEVQVDRVRWHEVPSLHDQGPNSRVYLTQRDEQGRTTVVFGDGVHGARLPTGLENVTATYRIGVGPEGAVDAGKLMLFQKRPLGMRAVTNPLPATGDEPPDTGAVARRSLPTSVLTLGRIVSVTDYETFALSFPGIGKARAAFLRRGEAQRLHLTLALVDGSPAPASAVLLDTLRAAMDAVRDTTTPVELAGFEPIWFRVMATLRTDPDRAFGDVAAAAGATLARAFSFEQRAFGQGVSAAKVVELLQGVPGVAMVDLNGLARSHPGDTHLPAAVAAWLPAQEARFSAAPSRVILPAQLLLLDPSPLGVTLLNGEELPP